MRPCFALFPLGSRPFLTRRPFLACNRPRSLSVRTDTSCILAWLIDEGYTVVCYMADVGQDEVRFLLPPPCFPSLFFP